MTPPRIRVGVLGAGAIAQMMHLRYLHRHRDIFELVRVVDISRALAAEVAARFGAADASNDPASLAAADVDAVVIATSGSHGAVAASLAQAGKHLLVEKPLCYTERESRDLAMARDRAGVVVQVGYMKRFDPAFRRARSLLADGPAPHLVQVTVLHPRERRYIQHHGVARASDVPQATLTALREEGRALAREALGERPAWALDMYTEVLLGSLVHDVNAVRNLVGEATRVASARCWENGHAFTAVLDFGPALVGTMSWCYFDDDLDYRETIGVHAAGRRLELRFPSPYLEHAVTGLEVRAHDGAAVTTTALDHGHVEAFEEELLAFASCVREETEPLTTVEDAAADIAVLRAMALSALDSGPVEVSTRGHPGPRGLPGTG